MTLLDRLCENREPVYRQAAGVIPVSKVTGRIFLAKRSAEVNDGLTWAVVGGSSNPGETSEQTARRELYEEVGYNGKIDLKFLTVYNDSAKRFRFTTFIGIVDDEFDFTLNYENVAAGWFTIFQAEKLQSHADWHFGLKNLWQNHLPALRLFAR